ncbi:hypothetical protein YYE_04980, partial [Plasmodium vinckei vinckei]
QDGGSSKTSQTGGSNSQNVPKTSENSKENTGGGNDNEGGQSDGNGNPGDGSSDPASSTPGGSFNLGSSLFKFLLNGAEKLNKTSQFIEKNRQTFKDAAEKINGAYNDIKDNLKNVYDKSSNYFSEIINNLTEQFNQVNTPSKPGNSGNDIPQNSDQSKENGDTLPPQPKDTSQNPPNQLPSTPPSDSLKDTPKDSQPNSSPTTPIDPTPQNQPSSQLQPITQQNQQDDPSNHKKIDNTIVHLVKSQSPDPNLKKPCNIFSTTWNGSEDCKPKIKFMSTTLVCCTSKQCNITGISVTLFLMPIILLIVYKYLSSGWRNELKGKKNMKKVINLFGVNKTAKTVINSTDRKKQIQIIIKSSNQKKNTKKSINSVYGEKSPSLNIYKIMQADPCKLLLEGDSYFKDEIVDMEKINKKTKDKIYYSRDGYKTNEERINALAAYIYMEFKKLIPRKQKHNHYDEYLLMWISDKLLKIHKKRKGKNIGKGYMDDFTLKRAYAEYLKKHKKGLDYWVHLDMMQGLKEANLWYMSEFYKLLNHICKIITYDETKGAKSREFSKNSIGCSRQYKTLYMNISECKSYVDLLNKLKGLK